MDASDAIGRRRVPMGTPQQSLDTRNAVFNAMDGHVLAKGVLTARFHRQVAFDSVELVKS